MNYIVEKDNVYVYDVKTGKMLDNRTFEPVEEPKKVVVDEIKMDDKKAKNK